jgi:hypothetical protein
MKIEEKEIDRVRDLICKIGLPAVLDDKSLIFFPIKVEEKTEETQEGVMLIETKKSHGSASLVKPGIVIYGPGKESINLAYASTEYSVPFDFDSHLRYIRSTKLTEEERSFMVGLECLLVRRENLLTSFFL